mmetsp:Transcript_2334/g.6252  ORF Transcript_2334/g.6252 Transcript_2334/m.6252 type:complete len:201 (-) Transcript_2334:980-1582(-)
MQVVLLFPIIVLLPIMLQQLRDCKFTFSPCVRSLVRSFVRLFTRWQSARMAPPGPSARGRKRRAGSIRTIPRREDPPRRRRWHLSPPAAASRRLRFPVPRCLRRGTTTTTTTWCERGKSPTPWRWYRSRRRRHPPRSASDTGRDPRRPGPEGGRRRRWRSRFAERPFPSSSSSRFRRPARRSRRIPGFPPDRTTPRPRNR